MPMLSLCRQPSKQNREQELIDAAKQRLEAR